MRIFLMVLILLCYVQAAFAGINLDAVYPYNLEKRNINTVYSGSTVPLYLNITSFDLLQDEKAKIKITLPKGFEPLLNEKWHISENGEQNIAEAYWDLPKDFGQTFTLLYIKAAETESLGEKTVLIEANGKNWQKSETVKFEYVRGENTNTESFVKKKIDKSKFNWYIQGLVFPVDSFGIKDERAEDGVIYVRDTGLESFRNRMTGEGATSWSSVFNHPAAYILLEMRNPQRDIRVLKFKAELIDKATGENVPGLCTAGKINDDTEQGWAGSTGEGSETTALISLDGKKTQNFILPIYIDYLKILEGDYSLRVTVEGNGQQKIQEAPLTIAKKHSIGLACVGFAFACFILVALCCKKIKKCVYSVGAKGAITIALFAAVAFGGITLPTNILGDLLHVFLGPFSGLITGLLNGVFQYLLIMSLLVLFRKPGVISLMFIVKFMLSGLMFGHFSPLGILSCAVYIVVLEAVLYFSGFFAKDNLDDKYMMVVAAAIGLADAFITFVNLEQIMFFYRLYYADWYLALYMIINGLLYSSIGCWLGYKTGLKLCQVMGE